MSRMERYHGSQEKQPEKYIKEKKVKKSPPSPPKAPKKRNGSIVQTLAKFLLLLVICAAAFTLYEYRKGYREAKDDTSVHQQEIDGFQGEKSQDGGLNVLILGSDSRGEDMGRADSIMVAHYSKRSKTPQIISFMRDSFVEIPGVGWNKINAAYAYGGPELVRQTIQNNFGLSIEYYAVISFDSFPKIIDTLSPSGIEMNVEKDLELDGVTLAAGPQKLNGAETLIYARFRKDEEGDFGRVRRQQQVMNELVSQGLSFKNLLNLPKTVGKVQGYTSTNIPARIYPGILKDFAFKRTQPLEKMSIPIADSWSFGNYAEAGSVLEIDLSMNQQAIAGFLK
ncbi:LCP family protein [Vagococcus elongatus]|uniref:Regulatory protein MsrR n=1 Tax=Vagococcus elongatus TaxID=180344 RepID=A0A430ASG5_9ENTE|nr:LCP family protein [Vagococcus elongatus]RSU11005.1 hypothetical protein CBF29_08565 [Vagococcus elongatus]